MAYETEYTDFDPQEDSSACLTLGLATDIVESRYLRDFSTAEPEEKQQILKDLTTFLEQLLRQPQISGSADAWHNLCVVLAQCDLYNLACITLERGLDFYPKSVDLLADYLQYGMECGQGERCKAVCKTLVKIPKSFWTWRGYRFLIGYETQLSLSGSEKELEKYKAEIDQRVEQAAEILDITEYLDRKPASSSRMTRAVTTAKPMSAGISMTTDGKKLSCGKHWKR